jgi:hypothetical protein
MLPDAVVDRTAAICRQRQRRQLVLGQRSAPPLSIRDSFAFASHTLLLVHTEHLVLWLAADFPNCLPSLFIQQTLFTPEKLSTTLVTSQSVCCLLPQE